MDFHAFMYVTIGRRHEFERGMAGKDPVLYRRMLHEIAEYARICDATGWSGIGIPQHHLQVEGFELGQDPGLMAMFLGQHGPRLRINQFGYVLPTHNPLRVAEHAATLDHLLGGRLNVAFVRGYQARWFENYAAVRGVRSTGPWNRKSDEDAMNRELFEEARGHHQDGVGRTTRSRSRASTGRSPQPDQRQPHEHPVDPQVRPRRRPRRGDSRGRHRAPAAAEPDSRRHPGFTHSLQTSLYWAREGGKPIVMAGEMDFCELLRPACYREVAESHGRTIARGGEAGVGRLPRAGRHQERGGGVGGGLSAGCGTGGRCRSARTGRHCSSATPTPSRA